jgi:hypothetical protein
MTEKNSTLAQPWWKFGHVWLVLSGPAIVVVASFITLYLAMTHVDPVLDEDYYRKGININKTLAERPEPGMVPAIQGRNHLSSDTPKAVEAP